MGVEIEVVLSFQFKSLLVSGQKVDFLLDVGNEKRNEKNRVIKWRLRVWNRETTLRSRSGELISIWELFSIWGLSSFPIWGSVWEKCRHFEPLKNFERSVWWVRVECIYTVRFFICPRLLYPATPLLSWSGDASHFCRRESKSLDILWINGRNLVYPCLIYIFRFHVIFREFMSSLFSLDFRLRESAAVLNFTGTSSSSWPIMR